MVPKTMTKFVAVTVLNKCGGRVQHLISALRSRILRNGDSALRRGWELSLMEYFQGLTTISGTAKSLFELLRECPFLCVCTRVRFSQIGLRDTEVMDRYAVCTWLDSQGLISCTCVGKTMTRTSTPEVSTVLLHC